MHGRPPGMALRSRAWVGLALAWLVGCSPTLDRAQEGFPCDEGQVCSHGLACVDGVCRRPADPDPCEDVVCPTGEICEDGLCEPVTAVCDPPCAAGERCEDGTCLPDVAACDPACDAGTTCTDGVCVPDVCDPACGEGEVCEGGGCVPAPCEPACAANEVCESGVCRALTCDEVTCAGNQRCVEGVCLSRCRIGNTWYEPLAAHPSEPCLHCDPEASTSDWSPRPEGTACGEGDVCSDLVCDAEGACIEDAHPLGTPCDDLSICLAPGECAEGCWIDDAARAPAAGHPTEPCLLCDPARALDAWSVDLDSPACLPPETCDAIVTFEIDRSPERELWVANDGSDATGDGSAGAPFRTVGRAAADATPGTAIRILPGAYLPEMIEDLSGTPPAPIWIGGAPGQDRPYFTGSGTGLSLRRPKWVVVHDLVISGTTQHGINVDDGDDRDDPEAARGLVVRDLEITEVGVTTGACVKLTGVRDFFVLDSVLEKCGGTSTGHGVDVTGGHRGLIARNAISDLTSTGIRVRAGSTDVTLQWNRIVDAGGRPVELGGAPGLATYRPPASETEPNYEARNLRMIGNLVAYGETGVAFVGCVDCLVAHNTFVEPSRWLMRILPGSDGDDDHTVVPTRDGRLVNNLFYFERGAVSTDVNVGPETEPDTFIFENNLWWAFDAPAASQPDLPGTEIDGIAGEDPRLTLVADTDAGLLPDSAAIGAGLALDEATADIRGVCWADPPSVGYWEGAE